MTIDVNGLPETKKVDRWLSENVFIFDKERKRLNLKLDSKVFEIMVSKLKQDKDYFRDSLGINHLIDFPGYDGKIKAIVPFNDSPVKFYKWYLQNKEKLNLSFADRIKLFSKVFELEKKSLLPEHLKMINK